MKLPKINPQNIIAVSALLISFFTACIYIYQARIMTKQHQDSVWAYVFCGRSFDDQDGLQLTVYNKGVGPAIIESVVVTHKGKEFSSWKNLLASWEMDSIRFSCSGTGILAASEEQLIFSVSDYEQAKRVWQKMLEVEIEVVYCSIHEECHKVNSKERETVETYQKKFIKCP